MLAHAADYVLLYPDPRQRSRELSATGHGYWPVAVGVAAALGAALLALVAVRGSRRRAVAMPSMGRIAALQMGIFTTVEVVERASVGVSPLPFLHSAQLAVGLGLQVVAAAACIFLLSRVERAARRVADLLRPRVPASPRARSWPLLLDAHAVVSRRGTPAAPRGPPLPART